MRFKVLSINKTMDHEAISTGHFIGAPSYTDYDVVIIDPKGLSSIWTSQLTKNGDGAYRIDSRHDEGFSFDILNVFNSRKEEIT